MHAVFVNNRVLRYIAIGGFAFCVEIFVLYLIKQATGSSILATAIAFWFGFVIAFLLQKLITFQEKSKQKHVVAKQAIFYALLVLFNYSFTLLFVSLLSGEIGVYIARTIALIITTAWNYYLYSKLVFTSRQS